MIFIQTNSENIVNYIYNNPLDELNGLGETEEFLLKKGYLVDIIPEKVEVSGKICDYVYDKEINSVILKYTNRVLTNEEKISQLQQQNAQLLLTLVEKGLI